MASRLAASSADYFIRSPCLDVARAFVVLRVLCALVCSAASALFRSRPLPTPRLFPATIGLCHVTRAGCRAVRFGCACRRLLRRHGSNHAMVEPPTEPALFNAARWPCVAAVTFTSIPCGAAKPVMSRRKVASERSAACGFNPVSARAPSRPLQGQGLLVSASPLCRGLPWWPPEMLRSAPSGGSFPARPHGTRQGRRRSMSGAVSQLVRDGRAAQASSAVRSAFIGRQWLPVCLPANGLALPLARYRRRSAEYP